MRARHTAAVVLLILGLGSAPARSQESTTTPAPANRPAAEPARMGTDAGHHAVPRSAAAALVRAMAAYEYGDMIQVVESTRPIAEGTLPASPEQRAQALRLLGIGLYLTSRALGAQNAFSELLRLDPEARLDPTTTRPEVVAVFETLRHQQLARERSRRWFAWNLLPPAGQFQNGEHGKAWLLLGIEAASLATFVTSALVLDSWCDSHHVCGPDGSRSTEAKALRYSNWASAGLLAASYVYGVVDAIRRYDRPPDYSDSLSLLAFPGGGGLRLTF